MTDKRLRPSEVFAARLREIRKARGLSQAELAQRMTESGRKLNKAALLRIENGERNLSLDEAITLAAVLVAVPAHLLSPRDGELVALTNTEAVDGDAMRNWLLTGNPILAWPSPPRDEDRATLDEILRRGLSYHGTALADAVRGGDKAGAQAAVEAIKATVDSHREAVARIEEGGSHAG